MPEGKPKLGSVKEAYGRHSVEVETDTSCYLFFKAAFYRGWHVRVDGEDVTKSDITHIHCEAGTVLVMRPLLSHSSVHATKGNTLQRRILHFEFAATPRLTDGYQWHTFLPLSD